MSMRERRKARREAQRTVLGRVATAPSSKPKKRRVKRKPSLRRTLIATMFLPLMLGILFVAPKNAMAFPTITPEVDPGSMASALTLLIGGVLALTGKVRRSK